MKKAQLIGISIALGAGAVAFFAMRSAMTPPPKPVVMTEKIDAVQVLVARADIGLGQVANVNSFRWQDWPKDAVSPAFITKQRQPKSLNELSGSIARAPMLAGEPVTKTKLIKAGSGGVLAAILPSGMRAVATKITEQSAAAKMILPNDHVDVILTQRKRGPNGSEEVVSDTLFRNVRVLSIGQQLEVKEGKKGSEGSVATLELTPSQSEMLAMANTIGDITLALRSVADLAEKADNSANRKRDQGGSVGVVRYGVQKRAYGVN
ncbi:MAG: hypothetical protein RLZ98_301 [Pseudomonadota bacterium]